MNVQSTQVSSPLPDPVLPWTERYLRYASEQTRMRVLVAYESIPRLEDVRAPVSYLHGMMIHHAMFIEGFTMLYPMRGRALYRAARRADRERLRGALVDCGTYNGGSTALLSAGAPGRAIWAFDSFEGLPPPSTRDANGPWEDFADAAASFEGTCLGSEERLREAVARYGSPARLRVCKGWFENTLPGARDEIGPIAVLHIDGDWYDSVYTVLKNLYELVVPGGMIVIDDYSGVPGAGRATDDFKASVGDSTEVSHIDQCGAYWCKPARQG